MAYVERLRLNIEGYRACMRTVHAFLGADPTARPLRWVDDGLAFVDSLDQLAPQVAASPLDDEQTVLAYQIPILMVLHERLVPELLRRMQHWRDSTLALIQTYHPLAEPQEGGGPREAFVIPATGLEWWSAQIAVQIGLLSDLYRAIQRAAESGSLEGLGEVVGRLVALQMGLLEPLRVLLTATTTQLLQVSARSLDEISEAEIAQLEQVLRDLQEQARRIQREAGERTALPQTFRGEPFVQSLVDGVAEYVTQARRFLEVVREEQSAQSRESASADLTVGSGAAAGDVGVVSAAAEGADQPDPPLPGSPIDLLRACKACVAALPPEHSVRGNTTLVAFELMRAFAVLTPEQQGRVTRSWDMHAGGSGLAAAAAAHAAVLSPQESDPSAAPEAGGGAPGMGHGGGVGSASSHSMAPT
jgi:hypothetical protein